MNPEVRRIAREARRAGYSARALGAFSDADWRDFREKVAAPRATLIDLADSVDLVLALEDGRDATWERK